MPELSYLEAIRAGLLAEMRDDPSVYVFGEDVALGGPFGVTQGIAEELGAHRVVNTPISEGTVMGVAIGAALVVFSRYPLTREVYAEVRAKLDAP